MVETRFPVRTAAQAPQVLMVEPGQGALDVGASLYELGLVRHPQVFRWHVALRGDDGRLRTGEYELKGELSLGPDRRPAGPRRRGAPRRSRSPRARTSRRWSHIAAAAGLDKEAFRRRRANPSLVRDLDPEATDLEGYLFPDTYDLPRRRRTRRPCSCSGWCSASGT